MSSVNVALQIQKRGVTVSAGAASANVAIPTASDGVSMPKYLRLVATAPAYVALGVGVGTTAAAGDMMVQPGDALVVCRGGATYVAVIQVTSAGVVQISGCENQ